MYARRLIAPPIVALVAALLVGAIIDSGKRARMARAAGPTQLSVPADPALAAEALRVRHAASAGARCTGTATCTAEGRGSRVRDAARGIDRWPSDPRFGAVRVTLRAQLLAQALFIEQRAADDIDGASTYATRAQLRTRQRHLAEATLAAARAQQAAGLMDRASLDTLVVELT